MGLSRRGLLHAGFLGALSLDAAAYHRVASAARRDRSVILLWLWGGPPHLDTFDPKPEAPLEFRGPYRAIDTNVPGIQVTELLPRLSHRAHLYSLIRTLHHDTSDHGLAGAIGMTGRAPQGGQVHPHVGSVVSRLRGFEAPLNPFVAIGERLQQGHRLIAGEGGGMLGAVYDPFRVRYVDGERADLGEASPPQEIDLSRVDRRRRLLEDTGKRGAMAGDRSVAALQRFYDQAFTLMRNADGRAVFDLEREPEPLRLRYGKTRFGQSCLMARRLVEGGVPFVQVNWSEHVEAEEDAGDGGWDNHYRNFEMLADRQCYPFDQACSALLDDLNDRGLLERTLVVAVGEFGRTPRINQMAGRDHWQSCYSALIAGGGVRGGRVVGASDDRGEYPASRPVTPGDLCLTMLESVGITRTEVLGLGLPIEGDVIHELF